MSMIRQIGCWFQRLLLLFLTAVIAVNGILLVKRLIYKEELPSFLGYSAVTVLSGSMEPEFFPGDVLIVQKRDDYQIGDIVTYQEENSYITHRIVEREGDRFLTRGDANNAPDSHPVNRSELYGKVKLIIPRVGNLLLFLKSPLGILILAVLGMALVEIPHLLERIKAADRERQKK